MIFNSLSFLLFFPAVFVTYWTLLRSSRKGQNAFLLLASYVFYGWWDWRFVFLLAFSTLLDYFSGLMIDSEQSSFRRKAWLVLSVAINLGFLGFFKYYNFFIESFTLGLQSLGVETVPWTLKIILPVGISFYTFHGLSYVFDIYYRRTKPTTDVVDYALFVAFFPLLVAGPIERATHLIPQVRSNRSFRYEQTVDGARQALFGFFKKMVVGDGCGYYVNMIFDDADSQTGSTLVLGAVLFAFQIYADFSGYSDIALGAARMLGFELLRNFSYPYFSRDIAEFWRRWHISLTTWFRDYVYIPMGGSKGGAGKSIRNTVVIFLVSGLWHGANWTFVVWGLINALYFIPLLVTRRNRANLDTIAQGRLLPTVKELGAMCGTFILTTFAWIFFRADSLSAAANYIKGIFSQTLFTLPVTGYAPIPFIVILVLVEWCQRTKNHGLDLTDVHSRVVRWLLYIGLCLTIYVFGAEQQEFIYFQF